MTNKLGKNAVKYKKDLSLEVMRIVAAFFVIFNHTGKMGFGLFNTYEIGSFRYWFYMPISIFCKFAVPVFFMISGALLLGKDEDIKTILKKRVLTTTVTLFFISVIYYIWNIKLGWVTFQGIDSIISFFILFFRGKIDPILWYLYSYIVFLLLLPLLRNAVRSMTIREYRYLFGLSFIVMTITPFLNNFIFSNDSMFSDFELFTTKNILYPLLGYYLYHIEDLSKFTRPKLVILWIINLVCIIVTSILTYKLMLKGTDSDHEFIFYNMFMMLYSFSVFVTIKRLVPSQSKRFSSIICTVGSCTLGVYLLQNLIILNPYIIKPVNRMFSNVPTPLIFAFIYSLCTFLICGIVTFILKKIPIIKKYI